MYYEVCSDEQHDDGYDDVHARLHVHASSCSEIRLVLCSLPITADPNSKPYPQRPEDNESSGLCFLFPKNHLRGRSYHDRNRTSQQDLPLSDRRHPRPAGCGPAHRGRGDLRHHRPERRRQEHARALYQSPRTADLRHGAHRRARHDAAQPPRAAQGAAGHRHDLPELQPARAAHGAAQHLLPARDRGRQAR